MNQNVTLSIGGRIYRGWKEVEIVRAIDTLTGSFRLLAAAKEDGSGADFQFKAGAAATIAVDGETLITGWIDRVSPQYDNGAHSIEISGRDRTADLVDCSAVHVPGSWKNARIEDIAAELAKPFGFEVAAKASTGDRLKRFAIQQGESAQEAIERALRYRGLLLVTNNQGNLEIITPKQSGVDFTIDSGRILEASAQHDVSERYSQYIVKGQASGDDETNGKAASKIRAEASDPAVDRYRPLVVIGEEQSTISALEKRAKWEATTRAARAQEAAITLQGWRDSNGALFDRNRIAQISDPWLFIDSPMLVTEVALAFGERGTTARLACSPPEAWSQMAIPEEREASRVAKGKAR